ncbi:AAA family ATPase [Pseudomonas sp. KNUC1026]|uniref:AAA family ATPase n=1 Tax=Pseudomonas sp. KNUC1026 TaxID=2893890 RepID=UPI001F2C4214|nr:ATP-binding protein [Pseudomonas sp. KNUC1026]UFH50681.1 AAA family ATPase [Pseudomonas sp. KNUC1026]
MIVSIHISGFKSLVDFSITDLGQFNCLVGLNGAGKTTVLQALDFTAQLVKGDLEKWLDKRDWTAADLHSKLTSATNIELALRIRAPSGELYEWVSNTNLRSMKCTSERVTRLSDSCDLLKVSKGKYILFDSPGQVIDFKYSGSLLSALQEKILHSELILVRDEIRNIRSLELLAPHLMRTPQRNKAVDIGSGGERLSSFLFDLTTEQHQKLLESLQHFYPHIVDFKVKRRQAGWKNLYLIEKTKQEQIETEARHVNDGLLRILAILAQTLSGHSLLIFDEIENGVNPEVTEQLVEVLLNSGQQILVTSHSPMVLNYLPDEVCPQGCAFHLPGKRWLYAEQAPFQPFTYG